MAPIEHDLGYSRSEPPDYDPDLWRDARDDDYDAARDEARHK